MLDVDEDAAICKNLTRPIINVLSDIWQDAVFGMEQARRCHSHREL